jgi:hypothetical protein
MENCEHLSQDRRPPDRHSNIVKKESESIYNDLFICNLFNGALIVMGYMASNNRVICEQLGRTWKEASMA